MHQDQPTLYKLSRTRSGDTTTVVFRWSYRQPGEYMLRAEVYGSCTESGTYNSDEVVGSAEAPIHVSAGVVYTNGPHLPGMTIGYLGLAAEDPTINYPPSPSPYYYDLWGAAFDFDGWVQSYSVDWGDGTPQEGIYSEPIANCWDPVTHWIPGGMQGPYVYHQYPGPGTYTVMVRASSMDCSGAAQQVGTQTHTVTLS